MDINTEEVGRRIKTIRIEHKETTAEFAKHFNPEASDSLVSRWERGVNLPNNERIEKIAELGDIPVDELLYGNSLEKYTNKELIDELTRRVKKNKKAPTGMSANQNLLS